MTIFIFFDIELGNGSKGIEELMQFCLDSLLKLGAINVGNKYLATIFSEFFLSGGRFGH